MWAVALGIAEAQPKQSETFQKPSGPDVGPPVTEADVRIVRRAREILKSPSNWNRPDSRICPPEATTFSLYCALERATIEVGGKFEQPVPQGNSGKKIDRAIPVTWQKTVSS